MATLTSTLRLVTVQSRNTFFKVSKVLFGLLIIGLGIGLGYLFSISQEMAELTISILVIFLLLFIIMKKPLYGLLAWVFFMAFIESWIEIPMGAGIPDLSFSRFAIAFLAIFMLAQAALGKLRFAPFSLADICIILIPIGILISAPLADNPKSAVQTVVSLHITPVVIYFFAKNLVRDKAELHQLLLAIAIFGFAAGSYAIFETTTGHVLFLSKGAEVSQRVFRGDTNLRLIQGLLSTGAMGRVLATTIPVTFYLSLESKNAFSKILLVGMIIAQFGGLGVTLSRTPIYSLLMALFVMQFFYPQFRKVFYLIVFVAALTLWANWDALQQTEVVEERLSDEEGNFNGRTPRWQAGFDMWKAKPIRGWGFGRYEENSGRFRTDGFTKNFRAIENDYLHILVSAGLIGFLPYLLFLLAPLINSLRLYFRARAPDWPGFIKPKTLAVYWAVILILLVTSYTAKQTDNVVKLLPFAITGAIVGSHEPLLRTLKTKKRSAPKLLPKTATVEKAV